MKLTETFQLLLSVGAATANKVIPKSTASSGAEFSSQTFDYIIVGGGTAGLAIAARLSEDPNVSVGVIEAGQYLAGDPSIDTPAFAPQLAGNAKYDWLFESTPQPNLGDRVVPLPRGKALGGSSAINYMAFDRASKVEHDAWASLGNPGWNWDGLLPYMKAAEHFTSVDPFRVNYTNANPDDIFPSQGRSGPVAGSYNNWYSDVTIPWWKTLKNLGIPANFDPDSGDTFGVFNSAVAVNRTIGKRSYAATTYYAYNAHRSNLVVLTGAQATKIEFTNATSDKGSDKITVTGVSFVYNSTSFSVRVKKEVILSTGTFQTPHLLELSGIGNATILRQYGITPLVNLPGVGENLQDHTYVTTNYELKPGFTTLDILRNNATYAAAAQAQYNSTHDGIFSSTPSMLSFIDIDYMATPAKIANMTAQLDREIAHDTITPLKKAQYVLQKKWLKQKLGHVEVIFNPVYFATGVPKANASYLAILSVNLHPFSRGNIHLNTSDPLATPRINLNWLSKSIDRDILVQSVKFGLAITKTEPLASIVVARESPAPEVTSDDDIIEYVKENVVSIHHPIGTAALAPRALGGVVDTDLKVYGTSNLRVADASIIPLHIGTHTMRTVYGIGEKAAAIIKNSS